MNKQNDTIIPDYSSFHREINDTSSPIIHDQEHQTNSSSSSSSPSSKKAIQQFEIIANEKSKMNSYASTDEDADEVNLDYPENLHQSTITIQTYRDRLNSRINPEINFSRSRIFSTEYSQTHDSGVDDQTKLDKQSSEQTTTTTQNLSDDSLLDIEPTPIQINDRSLQTPPILHEQSISLSDESDNEKNDSIVLSDHQVNSKIDQGLASTSEQYYSAESEFNTSLSFPTNDPYSGYELEDVHDDDDDEEINQNSSPRPSSSKFQIKLPSFGDWIDQVFTSFLSETNQPSSTSTSRSSSILSIHTSQNTLDTLSSPTLTVLENNPNLIIISKNPIVFDQNNLTNSSHRRSLSWPNDEQNSKGT